MRKFPRWVGLLAAQIASEEISAIAGNTGKVALAWSVYIESEKISTDGRCTMELPLADGGL